MAALFARVDNKENVAGASKKAMSQKPQLLGNGQKGKKPEIRQPLKEIQKGINQQRPALQVLHEDREKDAMAKKKQRITKAPEPQPIAAAPKPEPHGPTPMEDDRMSVGSLPEIDLKEELAGPVLFYEADEEDVKDPQMVTSYIEDIMAYFRKTEARRAPSPSYMSKQTDINAKMREILVDWLVEVHLKFQLRQETLFLTVNLIDRFLERRAVRRTKLQLVGCTAMLLASKYEEIYAPEVADFVYITDKAYTKDQLLAMEAIMLTTLKFNLTIPSPLRFSERFTKIAGGGAPLQQLTFYIVESQMQKYSFLKYMPSMIAASGTYIAVRTLGGTWDQKLVTVTQYAEVALDGCVRELLTAILTPGQKYCAVKKKYSSEKYGGVSKLRLWVPDGFAMPPAAAPPS